MTDPRITPTNTRVAAAHLADADPALARVTGEPAQVDRPLVDLLRQPDGPRDRQLLLGDRLTIYEQRDGWSFVQSAKDGYVGYVPAGTLSLAKTPTHWVRAPSTHAYSDANIKSGDRMALSFGSRLTALAETTDFIETEQGFVPRVHLAQEGEHLGDIHNTAALFLGSPYLWGGNSRFGLDCSGLVQAALLACGHPCPGDSDQQQETLGTALDPGTAPERGDLLFWKGHVALVTGPDTILHANGHDMAVAYEPLRAAVERIKRQGDGPVTAHKRL